MLTHGLLRVRLWLCQQVASVSAEAGASAEKQATEKRHERRPPPWMKNRASNERRGQDAGRRRDEPRVVGRAYEKDPRNEMVYKPFDVRSVEKALTTREAFIPLKFYRPKTTDLAPEYERGGDDARRRRRGLGPTRELMHRSENMATDQDWTAVWPTAASFKHSVVPLPVRQGAIPLRQLFQQLPPDKFNNVELIKIPNFLHLTPKHIEKHCEKLKDFCTPFPPELQSEHDCERHFPLEVTTRTYVHSGPSLRDERSRVVSISIRLSKLPRMTKEARDKLLRLLAGGATYDKGTDTLTITADRCPTRKQNQDYCLYLLTALYHQAQTVHKWEELRGPDDDDQYYFERMQIGKRSKELVQVHKVENAEEKLEKLGKAWYKARNVDRERIEDFEAVNAHVAQLYNMQPFDASSVTK